MTGIERLRRLAGSQDMGNAWTAMLANELTDIADQIEREQLRDPAKDVSMSAYDLLPQEDRDAIAWVRERGGIESVKAKQRESMPRAAYERKKAGFLDHIAECETALGRRRETISELNRRACDLTRENAELRKRAMPEGMSWPVFEDGEPVRIGDVVSDVEVRSVVFRDGGILLSDCTSVPGWGTWRSYKEPIKRPAPKVLDADGVEIREKRDVWWICEGDERGVHAERLRVETICPNGLIECSPYNGGTWVYLEPSELYVNKPVPASDGKPLHEGETVWRVKDGDGPYHVTVIRDGVSVCVDESVGEYRPDELTHERPDTWERIEEDAEKNPCDYFGFDGEETCGKCPASGKNCEQTMARDLVRRARALAGRDAS